MDWIKGYRVCMRLQRLNTAAVYIIVDHQFTSLIFYLFYSNYVVLVKFIIMVINGLGLT